MTYLDIVKNWLSLLPENKDDIDKTTNDFINAYIDEFGEINEFDLIEVHKLIKLSYCLGLKKCLYDSNDCPYMVVGGIRWKYCIPFEGNEHLLGTTDDCDEYFKNWE